GFILFAFLEIQTKLYKFDEGYCEFWYKIPVSDIFSMDEIDKNKDTLVKKYSYRITLYADKDSIFKEGIKKAVITSKQASDYILDYFPLYLTAGKFSYRFLISSFGETKIKEGVFEVLPETTTFYLSELMLFSKAQKDERFMRNGIQFYPLITPIYSNRDTLFSYIEIYGLVPDSLFYVARYQVFDSLRNLLLDRKYIRSKYEYKQFDTLSIYLGNYPAARYSLFVEIFEPALQLSACKECNFTVKEFLPDIIDKPYAWEIKYLVSENEYKKFCGLSHTQKVQYLKRFWSKRDYAEFEKRLIEADTRFSTSFKRGRDSPQGRFYILNGPPDEIRRYGVEAIITPDERRGGELERAQEVWIYESKGIEVLFRDNNGDGIYELIRTNPLGYQDKEDYFKNHRELEGYFR
ncbi:MAG: GWxTD domain-containing protein, partial [bacterium]